MCSTMIAISQQLNSAQWQMSFNEPFFSFPLRGFDKSLVIFKRATHTPNQINNQAGGSLCQSSGLSNANKSSYLWNTLVSIMRQTSACTMTTTTCECQRIKAAARVVVTAAANDNNDNHRSILTETSCTKPPPAGVIKEFEMKSTQEGYVKHVRQLNIGRLKESES